MPIIKTKRTDILRSFEIKKMLEQAEPWLQCLIALAWIFGKRINELLKVTKEDMRVEEGYLFIRFYVSKKKDRKDPPVPKTYMKRITLRNPYVKYILNYSDKIETYENDKEPHLLFPHMSRQLAYYYLKKVNPKSWFHLFRESLATEMAERGATEEKLMHWFDWDRVDTAHEYVKRGTKLTEEYSERTW